MYEWFEPFVQEWIHFIPVKWDLSDLFVQLKWARDHEEKAIEISKNARELGVNLFRPQIMACYSYCLLKTFHSQLKIDNIRRFYHDFDDVTFVCDSKRGKQKNCIDLRKMN